MSAAVLVVVRGGVAEIESSGLVEVGLIDFDDLEAGGFIPELSGAVLELARADKYLTEGHDFVAFQP